MRKLGLAIACLMVLNMMFGNGYALADGYEFGDGSAVIIGDVTETDAGYTFDGNGYVDLGDSNYSIENAFEMGFTLHNTDKLSNKLGLIYKKGKYAYPVVVSLTGNKIKIGLRTNGTVKYFSTNTTLGDYGAFDVRILYENGHLQLLVDGVLDIDVYIDGALDFKASDSKGVLGGDSTGKYDMKGSINNFYIIGGDGEPVTGEPVEEPVEEPIEEPIVPPVVEPLPIEGPGVYFIDYKNGDDNNTGNEPGSAWQHCPGDSNASGLADQHNIVPGDKYIFRGGVEYQGSIAIRTAGSDELPIEYIGDLWGEDKAVMSGSELIDVPIVKCESEDDAEGSPLYDDLYYFELIDDIDPLSLITENGKMMYFSMKETYEDLFWFRDYDKLTPIPEGDGAYDITPTSFRNDIEFVTDDADYYDNTVIMARVADNRIAIGRVTGFEPSSNTIMYSDLGQTPTYDSSDNCYYGLMNHIDYLDQPGEQYYNPDTNRLYIYPMTASPETAEYKVSTRTVAFRNYGCPNITIDGFEIREYAGLENAVGAGTAIYTTSGDNRNLIYRDNYIHDMRTLRGSGVVAVSSGQNVIIENNRLEYCQRGIGINASGVNMIINNNHLYKVGRSGMTFVGIQYSSITNNYISDVYDIHGNGLSVYRAGLNTSHDVLIAGNTIINADRPFTCHGHHPSAEMIPNNYVLYDNVFVSDLASGAISWGTEANAMYVFDNILISYGEKGSGMQNSSTDFNITAAGNILSGFSTPVGSDGQPNNTHDNIYVKLAYTQNERYGWSFGEGEVLMDPYDVFVDYDNKDVTLRDGIEMPDSGVDINDYVMTNEDGYMILRP